MSDVKSVTNVKRVSFGFGSLSNLRAIVEDRTRDLRGGAVFFVDEFLHSRRSFRESLPVGSEDQIIRVPTQKEPTTSLVDGLAEKVAETFDRNPCAIIGIGGGSTLDCTKAVSNLLTNQGKASDYQGWDLVRKAGVYKVGVPTLSGTGAEATRTCVMTNLESGVKLGMNSDFSVFDEVVLDPDLTATAPRDQYFFSGMDAFIHCVESLGGKYRHAIGDIYSQNVVQLCKDVFLDQDMMSDENRSKLMTASYLGGSAIGMTLVGLVHPFSAGLSVVLGLRHCVSNCIVMQVMEEFYPEAFRDFIAMAEKQEIKIPDQVCANLSEHQFKELYESMIVHSKPLENALGPQFQKILSEKMVRELYEKM